MTQRVWNGVHDDAPTDADGRPVHPDDDKDYHICGMPKSDRTTPPDHGRDRDDVPYCTLYAGWGTDRKTGACSKHGGAGGAPEGWQNGNARHLLYSKRMNDDDREEFEAIVETADGDRIGVSEMTEMLENMVGFEYMRLSRAVDAVPGVSSVTIADCPRCGEQYRIGGDDDAVVDHCTGEISVTPQATEACGYTGDLDVVPGKSFVDFGDKAVERKEAKLANLMSTYKELAEGRDVNVSGDHTVETTGTMSVNITSVGIDLADDPDDDGDGGDA